MVFRENERDDSEQDYCKTPVHPNTYDPGIHRSNWHHGGFTPRPKGSGIKDLLKVIAYKKKNLLRFGVEYGSRPGK